MLISDTNGIDQNVRDEKERKEENGHKSHLILPLQNLIVKLPAEDFLMVRSHQKRFERQAHSVFKVCVEARLGPLQRASSVWCGKI